MLAPAARLAPPTGPSMLAALAPPTAARQPLNSVVKLVNLV